MKERKDIVSEGCLSDLMSDNGHRLQHYKDIRNENLTIMDLTLLEDPILMEVSVSIGW